MYSYHSHPVELSPIDLLSTSVKVIEKYPRLSSIFSCFLILTPFSERSTSCSDTPESVFATTIAWVAISASGTAIFVPLILPSLKVRLIFSADGAFNSSATARVPTISPLTSFGSISFLIESSA